MQAHRLSARYFEGGASYAQLRRFHNFEQLLYAKENVHLDHVATLVEMTSSLRGKAATICQRSVYRSVALGGSRRRGCTGGLRRRRGWRRSADVHLSQYARP